MPLDPKKLEAVLKHCDSLCQRLDRLEKSRADASDETMEKRAAANEKRGRILNDSELSLKEYLDLLKRLADMKGSTVAEEHEMLKGLALAAAKKAANHAKEFTAKEKAVA